MADQNQVEIEVPEVPQQLPSEILLESENDEFYNIPLSDSPPLPYVPPPPSSPHEEMPWELEESWETNRRQMGFLKTAFFFLLIGLLVFKIIPGRKHNMDIDRCRQSPHLVVAAEGSGDFTSVSAAVEAIPDGRKARTCGMRVTKDK